MDQLTNGSSNQQTNGLTDHLTKQLKELYARRLKDEYLPHNLSNSDMPKYILIKDLYSTCTKICKENDFNSVALAGTYNKCKLLDDI